MKLPSQRNIYTHIFIAVLFTIIKTWKQPKRPLADEWMKRVERARERNRVRERKKGRKGMEHHSVIKKGNPALCDIMDGP